MPALVFAAGLTRGSVVAAVTPTTPGKYDHGQLLVSHEGQLVSQVALDSVLAQGGSVSVSVPARHDHGALLRLGTAYGIRAIRVAPCNGSGTPDAVDLRATSSGATAVTRQLKPARN